MLRALRQEVVERPFSSGKITAKLAGEPEPDSRITLSRSRWIKQLTTPLDL
ncbi:hypothetical protein RGR602_PC00595 (plasmid) [Rhizobium gallicum bv. gallicum R602sp]|uniref:Uncharacterized protein n=1 Tax=Rhizobium gallicum bv. gallicum R602sp TaxID=1041138 RepID=A0A0B4X9F4_9HYPH|nr:hypothetical protein RGR602_PC00595 [Rhizobium gallicum bv. gallicum R602sp]